MRTNCIAEGILLSALCGPKREGNKITAIASLCKEVHQGRDETQSDKAEIQ